MTDAVVRTAREIAECCTHADAVRCVWTACESCIAAALVEARANAFREAAQVAKSYPLRTWPVLPELERELSVAKFVRDEIAAAISRIAWPEKEEELNGR